MVGRLYHLPRAVARARADELLERFDLTDAADRLVRTFSGGMRRRLDLAASLVATPPVLFLDEPTTGLDPRSRIELWALLRELVRDGATMLLTTQYLEEADRRADDIVVLDGGRVVAHGAPAELKARVGGERLEVTVGSASELAAAATALSPFASDQPFVDTEESRVVAPVTAGVPLAEVVRALDAAGVDTTDLHRREATLDDVFLALTEPAETTMEVAA
jgi:ABC-2 type transport system ATP-binding protein